MRSGEVYHFERAEWATAALQTLLIWCGASGNSAYNIRSFSQTRIDGSVHPDAKSIIVFQTPFDPGWQARQDGRVTPVLKVDVGLLGSSTRRRRPQRRTVLQASLSCQCYDRKSRIAFDTNSGPLALATDPLTQLRESRPLSKCV